MQRQMDLVRALLLKLESLPLGPGVMMIISPDDPKIAIDGYTPEQTAYHLALIREAGYIESPGSQPTWGVTFCRLSWEGHDFLDAIRDPEIWRKTKKSADEMGSFTLDLLKDLAKGFIRKKIEEHTGVKL